MTKLSVSYPPSPPRKRRERVTTRAIGLLWSVVGYVIAIAAVWFVWAALTR